MAVEEKYAIGLGVLSVVLLAIGWLVSKRLSHATPGTLRAAVPVAALLTVLSYGIFVAIARSHVKG